jgi:hypothetical protein
MVVLVVFIGSMHLGRGVAALSGRDSNVAHTLESWRYHRYEKEET